MSVHEMKSRFVLEGEQKYRSAMTEAANAVKVLNSEQKLAAAQFKQTGDAEKYAADQSRILKEKIEQQKTAVKAAEQAIKQMTENGVAKNDRKMQQWQEKLNKAQTELTKMQTELQGVGGAMDTATQKTDKMNKTLESIGKKVNLDAVINGVGKISGALEKAAQKAAQMGQAVWDAVMDSAERADNTATAASILGMSIEDYQRYAKVFNTAADITVNEWQKAKQKVNNAIYSPSSDQTAALEALGINTHKNTFLWNKNIKTAEKNYEDLFWEIGETLRAKVQSGQITQGLADDYANAIFGKSWANLNPIFNMGRNAFEEALAEQTVVSEDAVNKLAELNDTIIKLQGDFKSLQDEVTAGLAPALQGAAEVLSGLLANLMEYLKSEDGQEALKKMGDSVSGLFEDLGKIDPKSVVQNFAKVFDNLVGGFKWINEHKGELGTALKVIAAGWATTTLTEGALQVLQLVNGIRGLTAGSAAAAGEAAGASWGGAFAAAVMKAAPWLVGLYTLLNPSGTAGNDLDVLWDPNTGEPTQAGRDAGITWNIKDDAAKGKTPEIEMISAAEALQNAGETLGDAADILKKDSEKKEQDGTIAPPSGILPMPNTTVRQQGESIDLSKVIDISMEKFLKTFFGSPNPASESSILGKPGQLMEEWTALGIPAKLETAKQDLSELVNEILGSKWADEHSASNSSILGQPGQLIEEWNALFGVETVEVPAELDIDPEAAQEEASKITVQIGARIVPVSFSGGGGGGGAGKFGYLAFHANGIWDVPFDGYPAILHRGERVMPAREVSSRSYNSNLYVEKMYMNNGTDAEGLASAMAVAQRRRMNGYGS